ncbi:MAG TPA: hypothetical protein PKL08_13110, partial [Thermoanaerobaculaceae bacterium]|nr:hypothetical protein [Thermoanaerobaculaceae bacterium]
DLTSSGGPVAAAEVKSGKIAKIEGSTAWINLGSANGVNVGDSYAVYELGEPIKDPDSGEVLGQDEKRIGHIRVVAVKGPKYSECTIVDGTHLGVGNIVK